MSAADLELLGAVGSIVGVASFVLGLYLGLRQLGDARRQADEAAKSQKVLSDMSSTLRIVAAKNLEPIEPLLRKGVIFSVWNAIARLGLDTNSAHIMRWLEVEEPETSAAWKVNVPLEKSREILVDEILTALRASERRQLDAADGMNVDTVTKIPYNHVAVVKGFPPFTTYARLSRHPWVARGRLLLAGVVFVLGLSLLVTIAAAGGFVYLDYLLAALWPFAVALAIAAIGLFEIELSRHQYAEECRGRHEYAVLFGPGSFLHAPTQVFFGRYCPAAIFSAGEESGLGRDADS
ncbi:MAG: hypothetical protein L3K05_00050 [Thermoplasmata archaeon]|nr:hypothetical protein [Thermoplasmata archaeon]